MVSKQQRERELARAKWQRQQLRRQQATARTRRRALALGGLVGFGAVAVVVWVVWQAVGGESPAPVPEPVASVTTQSPTPEQSPTVLPTTPAVTTPRPPVATSTPTVPPTP